MRPAYGILILSLSGLCGAMALPQQDAPLAEKQFKNIQSFKGEKASDVIPAMQFMSASLKVDCEFCHTADRSSDDLEPKRTTREMIAMQRDINKRNFNGRNQITCATCHGGHTRPVSLPPVTGLEVRARRSPTVVPTEVLSAYGKAVGADMAHSVTGLHFEGTTTANGEKSKVEATYSGDKYYYVVHSAKGDIKQGFNGSMAWFPTEHGPVAVPMQIAIQYINQKAIFTGPDSLPKLSNLSGGTAKIGLKDNLVVMGTAADKSRVSFYFDKATGLLSRSVYSYPTVLGSMAKINDYSDYKKVNGLQLPTKIVYHATEGDTTFEFRTVRTEAKVEATQFDPPQK